MGTGKVFKLSCTKSNIKSFNGWSSKNETLYNELTYGEQKLLNKILIKEIQTKIPSKRSKFYQLYLRVTSSSCDHEIRIINELKNNLIKTYGYSIIERLN